MTVFSGILVIYTGFGRYATIQAMGDGRSECKALYVDNSPMKHRDRFILLSAHDLGVTGGKMETRVTLRPGDKGTKKLVQEFGQKLLCVRYRYDPVRRMRHKTVELVVESAPWDPARQSLDGRGRSGGRPPVLVGVRVEYREEELRRRIKA